MKNIISIINSSYNPASQISRCLGSQLSTAEPAHDKAGALRTVLNSCFMALRTLLLVLLMLLPSCAGARVLAKDYMTLVKKTSKSSIKSVMRQADRYLRQVIRTRRWCITWLYVTVWTTSCPTKTNIIAPWRS